MSKLKFVPRILLTLLLLFSVAIVAITNVIEVFAASGYYWVGHTGVWSNLANWSSTDDGTGGDYGVLPTSADNVYFATTAFNGAGQVVTVDVTAYCADMDWTGATNSPTLAGSSDLHINGNTTFIAAMTMTISSFIVVDGACTLTTNGLTLSGSWVSNAVISLADDMNMGLYPYYGNGGGLTTNNNNIDMGVFSPTNGAGLTYNLGSSTINCTSFTVDKAVTINANTATINISGTGSCALYTANYNGASFNLNGTAHTVSGSPTGITTFRRTGTATKTDTVTFTSGATLTCTNFAIIGNSVTNRVLAQSSTLGTAATITATNWLGTENYFDMMDLTFTNAKDLSAISVGDCGGNTGITFTPAAAQISNATGNWSTLATWQDGVGTDRVPLPQDDVTCSHTVTVDMPRIGKSITFTGTPTVTLSNVAENYGSLTFASGMSYNPSGFYNYPRGRSTYSLTTNGINLLGIRMWAYGGTYTLQDDLTLVDALQVFSGTLDFNDNAVDASYINTDASIHGVLDVVKTLVLGSGTITLTATHDVVPKWAVDANTTVTCETSTIVMSNSGATGQRFSGAGKTYYDIQVEGAGAYALTITGDNTFATFDVDASSAAKGITATGTTQTVDDFTRDAGGTNVITITNGTWTKSDATDIFLDYLSVSGSTATPATTWYAGDHAVNGGGNTDWVFDDPSLSVTTNAASGITMDKDGVTGGNFNGTITTLAGTPYIQTNYDYGLTVAYGTTTANVNKYSYGAYSATIPNNLTPGETYHFRASITDNAGTFTGADANFTLTMPTFTTLAVTSNTIIRGQITDMGVASTCYGYFQWGYDPLALVNTTAQQTINAPGTFTYDMATSGFDSLQTVYYRAVVTVGATTENGATLNFLADRRILLFDGVEPILLLVPMLLVVGIVTGSLLLLKGIRRGEQSNMIFGIVIICICVVLLELVIGVINDVRRPLI